MILKLILELFIPKQMNVSLREWQKIEIVSSLQMKRKNKSICFVGLYLDESFKNYLKWKLEKQIYRYFGRMADHNHPIFVLGDDPLLCAVLSFSQSPTADFRFPGGL